VSGVLQDPTTGEVHRYRTVRFKEAMTWVEYELEDLVNTVVRGVRNPRCKRRVSKNPVAYNCR
jgi:hypothetical protein